MAKRGSEYEALVADIVSAFDRKAEVTQGVWVDGPDGRRDMDVSIKGVVDGRQVQGVIECKDFDPKATGRVGIEYVDALDSKRHDVKADFAIICSNSGFTADALSKAKRKKIGMISVLVHDDARIKVRIVERVYIRNPKIENLNMELDFGSEDAKNDAINRNLRKHSIMHEGLPIDNWLMHRIMLATQFHPFLTGPINLSYRLKVPTVFKLDDEEITLTRMSISFSTTIGWFCQDIEIDAKRGIYDWLRGKVRLGGGENSYILKEVNVENPTPCDPPEDKELLWLGIGESKALQPGELDVQLCLIHGLDFGGFKGHPRLDDLIVQEDLENDSKLGVETSKA